MSDKPARRSAWEINKEILYYNAKGWAMRRIARETNASARRVRDVIEAERNGLPLPQETKVTPPKLPEKAPAGLLVPLGSAADRPFLTPPSPWTLEEDTDLLRLREDNPHKPWAALMPFFPGRTVAAVKARWRILTES
jgi:hypothetical protein